MSLNGSPIGVGDDFFLKGVPDETRRRSSMGSRIMLSSRTLNATDECYMQALRQIRIGYTTYRRYPCSRMEAYLCWMRGIIKSSGFRVRVR